MRKSWKMMAWFFVLTKQFNSLFQTDNGVIVKVTAAD